ncbi:54S ribosomal protein L3 mitochondrial [Vermiconidia calcicola]|uniref:54S ribosomal protein L3 mitochondrial n=1 Tax=Vermiconidia calcicola TaxID=1690605 RepID=A0ACC3MU94_9PEZI|nr:54S ribosomal protein L3 mitochondrial [Vermiconidia calcicola]
MKRIRLDRWASQLQPPRNPRLHLHQQRCPFSNETRPSPRREFQQRNYQVQHQWQCQRRHAASRRKASSAVAAQVEDVADEAPIQPQSEPQEQQQRPLNAPSHRRALKSAKLSALHARLSLPSKLPLQTLARCLIDPSVDSRHGYNNEPLALLGQELLGYYTSEWLLCRYPRLPVPVLFAAQYAYVGSQTLGAMRSEWGVETVAAPGPEVDPGLLQLKRVLPGNAMVEGEMMRVKDMPQARRLGSGRRNEQWNYRRGMSSRIVYDDQFGDLQTGLSTEDRPPFPGAPISTTDGNTYPLEGVDQEPNSQPGSFLPREHSERDVESTVEAASASFVRALAGALYLHAGSAVTKTFHKDHVLSRHLPLHTLFNFTHPTRDLSRLCAREGFEPPVARLISETGRLSRTPVFVVGVFSGEDKLGEGAGSSLNEGRVRAAAAALRSWYLYSPPESEIVLPSEVEGGGADKKAWKPQMVDIGEIVT